MNGRIGHLHCRYRIIGGRGSAGATSVMLDRLAVEDMPEAYDAALDKVFGDDPAVYVVRRVEAEPVFVPGNRLTDPRLTRIWGERLAGAVVRAIARDTDDGDKVVKFTDQAEYVAHFICDFLQGVAWERWFYGAFSALRSLSPPEALHRVLLENREQLSVVLAYLHRERSFDRVLALLDAHMCRTIWEEGLRSHSAYDPASLRPIFALALRLVDNLDLWRASRPDGEELFQGYLATTPSPPDWRDRRGLAAALFSAVSFLAARGLLSRIGRLPDEPFVARLDQSLAEFDWADSDWLRMALLELLQGGAVEKTDLPVRPAAQGPTPRQRELMSDLLTAFGENDLRLDWPAEPVTDDSAVAANALKLYAALVARAPRWADDPVATALIQQLVTAWFWLRQSQRPMEMLWRLRERDLAGALQTLPVSKRDVPAFKFATVLGDQALALLYRITSSDQRLSLASGESNDTSNASSQMARHQLIGNEQEIVPGDGQEVDDGAAGLSIETAYAGVGLLLRAVVDTRLWALVKESGCPGSETLPGLSAMLLGVGLRLGVEKTDPEPQLDPGLCRLAGLDHPVTVEQLRAVWAEASAADCWQFQSALLRIVAGQRLLQASTIHLFQVELGDGRKALVVGDETARLWPLGNVIEPDGDVAPVVARLIETWLEAAGRKPERIVADDSLAVIAALGLECDELIFAAHAESLAPSEAEEIHRAGRKALQDILRDFNQRHLNLPNADLMMDLTATILLRMWARWLRQFADSSIPYLLDNFIHRSGSVSLNEDALWVELEQKPLDIVLEMAGYTADLWLTPWLKQRRVRFQLRGA
ncbi:MAG: hypothetical protein JST85_15830 [Acidobacteria bacterium]|nr:hypothetical protein [Acidobacteriota bacterium]